MQKSPEIQALTATVMSEILALCNPKSTHRCEYP